jgi:excisionase family DNA binding protein
VTRSDAAEFLNVSVRQVDRLIADGSLPAVRIGERSIRIRQSALDALLVPVIHGGPSGRPAA